MSTNKNTFKYLCFIFGITLVHLIVALINPIYVAYEARLTVYLLINTLIPFLLMSIGIFFAAKCTGLSALVSQSANRVLTLISSAILSPFILTLDLAAVFLLMLSGASIEHFNLSETVLIVLAPVSYFVCLTAVVFTILFLCKLITLKSKLSLPRGPYLTLCFAPPLLFLTLTVLQMAVYYTYPETTVNYMTVFTNFYSIIKDITIGWSIFCMMKYNQSMKIKTLLEMQLQNMAGNT